MGCHSLYTNKGKDVCVFVCVSATKPKMVHPVIIIFLLSSKPSTEIAKSLFSPERSEGGNNALSKIDENK